MEEPFGPWIPIIHLANHRAHSSSNDRVYCAGPSHNDSIVHLQRFY